MPNKELLTKWVEALESGKYDQCRGHLRRGDSNCCLGVLANVYGVTWISEDDGRELPFWKCKMEGFETGTVNLDYKFWDEVVGVDEAQGIFMCMNDHEHKTFKEIAEYVREKYLG